MNSPSVPMEVVYETPRRRVCVLYPEEFHAYVSTLPTSARRKVIRLIKRCGDSGPPLNNRQQCLKLKDTKYLGLYELKSKPHRLLFFSHETGGDLIITNCFAKQRDPGDHPEYDKARRRRDLYLSGMRA